MREATRNEAWRVPCASYPCSACSMLSRGAPCALPVHCDRRRSLACSVCPWMLAARPARPAAELHASRGILPTLVALADGKRAWCRGPTGLLLNELADHSFNYAECRIIFVRAQAPC